MKNIFVDRRGSRAGIDGDVEYFLAGTSCSAEKVSAWWLQLFFFVMKLTSRISSLF